MYEILNNGERLFKWQKRALVLSTCMSIVTITAIIVMHFI